MPDNARTFRCLPPRSPFCLLGYDHERDAADGTSSSAAALVYEVSSSVRRAFPLASMTPLAIFLLGCHRVSGGAAAFSALMRLSLRRWRSAAGAAIGWPLPDDPLQLCFAAAALGICMWLRAS